MALFLKAERIAKSYGDRVIFDIEALTLHKGKKVGLVGSNGAGKSSLLAVLSGDAEPDAGKVERRGAVALVRQQQDIPTLTRQTDAGEKAGRRRFSAAPLSARPSGGELTRAALDAALAAKPNVLLADEPTTNLDMEGIERLQGLLRAFKGALIMVSHDRELLDAVCNEIWELEDGALRTFPGNYSAWLRQKERERNFASFEYENYRKEKKRLEEAARKMHEKAGTMLKPPTRMSASEAGLCGNKGGALNAQSGIYGKSKAIAKRARMIEEKERPADLPEIRMALGAGSPLSSESAIRVSHLRVAFDGRAIFDDASFEVRTGMRTILLGPNGSGKTTLLRAIESSTPGVKIAPAAKIGYFGQNHEALAPSKSVLENARSISDLPEHEVRTILARLEIKGDDVHKPCGVLSGGERAKVAFARLFASRLNVLIMDEPTNHIDLYTSEALESLLLSWQGTLLLVTHDRRLIERTAQRILTIEDGHVSTFEGSWEEYRQRKASLRSGDASEPISTAILEMRMAALGARLAGSLSKAERDALEKEWQALLTQLRASKKSA